MQIFAARYILGQSFIIQSAESYTNQTNELTNEINDNPSSSFNSIRESYLTDNKISVIVNDNYELQNESDTYVLNIEGTDYFLSNYKHLILENTSISISHDSDDNIVSYTYNNETLTLESCETCTTLSGNIDSVDTPNNLNAQFSNDYFVLSVLDKLKNTSEVSFESNNNTEWTQLENPNGYTRTIVLKNKLSDGTTLLTIVELPGGDKFFKTITVFSTITYIVVFILSLFIAYFFSKMLAKPLVKINTSAKDIADLNFTKSSISRVGNKETFELSQSVNKISDNLSFALEELNNSNNELKNQFEFKKTFVSAVSHELKTPLAVIQATISGIEDGIFTKEEEEKELKNIQKEVNKSSDMIQEILNVYKLEDKSLRLDLVEIDLVEYTEYILEELKNFLNQNQTPVNFKHNKQSTYINVDVKQLHRVLQNLILNACKYSEPTSPIDIIVDENEDDIIFSISNYGVSIPPEDLKNIFEPFYRVDKTGSKNQRKSGTGLGLFIIKQILVAHNFEFHFGNIINGVRFVFKVKK